MLTLTNLSNADCDVEKLLQNSSGTLAEILHTHMPDGIEFMLCAPWDRAMFSPTCIQGVHLMFQPIWVTFGVAMITQGILNYRLHIWVDMVQ